MFDTDKPQERGQVGIGTLIVFIALVLVAAIAAGVLINTAGFLQSQAEQTGQDSTDQVANNLDVELVSGTVTADGTDDTLGVTAITAQVTLAPGSDPIALDSTTIEIYPEGESRATETGGFEDDTGSGITSLDSGETAFVTLTDANFGSYGGGPTDGASTGQGIELVFVTPDGSQTQVQFTVPETLNDGEELILN